MLSVCVSARKTDYSIALLLNMWSRNQQHREQLRARLKSRCSGPAADLLNQNQCWNVIMKSFLRFTFQWRTEGLSCSALYLLTSINYSHEKFEKILYLQNKNCHMCVCVCVCVCVYVFFSFVKTMVLKIIMAVLRIIGRLKTC